MIGYSLIPIVQYNINTVVVDHQLRFSTQIKSVLLSFLKSLRKIKRTISKRCPKVFKKLYKALVCPPLEVGMFLVSPYSKKTKTEFSKGQSKWLKASNKCHIFIHTHMMIYII